MNGCFEFAEITRERVKILRYSYEGLVLYTKVADFSTMFREPTYNAVR